MGDKEMKFDKEIIEQALALLKHIEEIMEEALNHLLHAIRSELIAGENIEEPEDTFELALLVERLIREGHFAFSPFLEKVLTFFSTNKAHAPRFLERVKRMIAEEKKKVLLINEIERLWSIIRIYKEIIIIEKQKELIISIKPDMIRQTLINEPFEAVKAITDTLQEIVQREHEKLWEKVDYNICERIREYYNIKEKGLVCFKVYEDGSKIYVIMIFSSGENT